MKMKKHLLLVLFFALCMLVTVAGAATIVAPGYPEEGLLPPGSPGVFPVSVGNLTDAQGVHFNLTFDRTVLSVENVSANTTIPGSTVFTNINNEAGWVQVAVTNTEGITVNETRPLTPLVDITFRPIGSEGESAMKFAGTPTYSQGEEFVPVDFDEVYSGSIAIRKPSTIQAPSGTLSFRQPGVFPVSVGDLTDAQGVHFNLTFDRTVLSVENVSANTTIPGSTVFANINNEAGWVQVAVTNTDGITVNETQLLTPLVDITFRPIGSEGRSAIEFAGTPTYSQGEGFVPMNFDEVRSGSIAIRKPSTIQAPSGTLSVGQPGTFAVGVNNITGATQIWFELMYDGSYLIVDDVAPALPGAVIIDAHAYNGAYDDEEFGPALLVSVPEEMHLNLQQPPHMNMMWVELEIPDGLTTTEYTDIIDITFRPTNRTGTSDLEFYWGCTYLDESGSTHDFNLQIPGQIVTSGGGSYPAFGEFKAPSGTIDVGSQKVLPIMVRSLNNAKEAYVWTQWNPAIINVTSVSLNATARDAGVTLDWSSLGSSVYDNISTGYLYADFGNMTNLNTASWTPLLDLTVRANATSGQTPVNISGSSYTVPRENVSIGFPPTLLENGQISINVMPPPPIAAFVVNVTSGPAPLAVQFTDTSTGELTAWLWSFGDGVRASTRNATHIYNEAGTYTARLTVTGPGGSNITEKAIIVGESVTGAAFTADLTTGAIPLTVRFTDTSPGNPSSWNWNFGDGNTSTVQNPTHTYTLPGNHTVTLSVDGGPLTTKHGYIKATPVLFGDANGDGRVNQADTLLVLQQVVGLKKEPDRESEQFQRTDVNHNGVIEVSDAMFIAQYNVGLRNIWFELWG